MTKIDDVRSFWENNPLWTGESVHPAGSIPFFEEHREVYMADCFGGGFDLRFLPPPRPMGQAMSVLDLGCGIGFWVSEFAMRGLSNLDAADLTEQALAITAKRLEAYGLKANLSLQNAEKMTFPDHTFDHVNCQGVIHHTPDTNATVAEIARVLKPGGTASISVYYRNPILRLWPYVRWLGWPLAKLGGGLKGRGREKIFLESNVDEIVRLYDGIENPIGKSYTREQFLSMLEKHFIVQETYLHFFPARALPFQLSAGLHRWLDKHLGFMIYATLKKPCAV
ncbi:MAG: class I SAM-dependent methyltransferase [Magnetococcales bacterium]|nr:class I SAM-dependent methyltransferase [Magnetococcales bacterium]